MLTTAVVLNNTLNSSLTSRGLPNYRPNDWIHMHYAVKAYQESGGQALQEEGWTFLDRRSLPNSYFGVAYIHRDKKHVIIAHRGTQDLEDWRGNADFITRHLGEQQESAWSFAKEIIQKLKGEYSYSFTGHSLGGWLAQTCLWNYQDEFMKEQTDYQEAFAVTLDDPGAEPLLEALQPRVDKAYRVDSDHLDITAYLSWPNIVNTALGHVGSTYALFPKVNLSWLEQNTIGYTLRMHQKEDLLALFTRETGLPETCLRVIDWPKVMWGKQLSSASNTKSTLGYVNHMMQAYLKGDIDRSEYLGFFNYVPNQAVNPEQLPSASGFQLKHGVHYSVKAFDEQVLPLRNMPSPMRRFLEELKHYPDRIKLVEQLALNPMVLRLPLEAYDINEREELVLNKSKTTARQFRAQLSDFLRDNPALYQTKLAVLREEYFSRQLQSLKVGTLPGLLADMREQALQTLQLIERLSFQQGTARLYKLIKPSREELQSIQTEHASLERQLVILKSSQLNLKTLMLPEEQRLPIEQALNYQEQLLNIAKQSTLIFISYLQDDFLEAEKQLTLLVLVLEQPSFDLPNKNILLNRAYNLKAKIAARQEKLELAKTDYQKALSLFSDALTLSNYGGLLVDIGRAEKEPSRYLEAYQQCFQKLYLSLGQIEPQQLSIVCSGMAYGLILLAQSVQHNAQPGVPDCPTLRHQAHDLLNQAIKANSQYLNAHLFLAILCYDEEKYPDALQEVNMALSLQPMHSTGLMRKGFILEKLRYFDEALNILSQVRQQLASSAGWVKEIDERIAIIQSLKQQPIAQSPLSNIVTQPENEGFCGWLPVYQNGRKQVVPLSHDYIQPEIEKQVGSKDCCTII